MTLPTWSDLVKRLPAHAQQIWLGGALLLLALLGMLRLAQDPQTLAQDYGERVAESVAQLCVGPLIKQDRIELGLLSNRMAQLPGVTGITLVGVDRQVLSVTTENPPGMVHSQPITLDDAVIGYVRVSVDPGTLAAVPRWPWLAALLLLFLAPWLLRALERLLIETQTLWQTRQPQETATSAGAPETTERPVDDYVLIASLLNQLGLSANEQHALLATTAAAASQVARLYRGHVELLPGKGLAIWFGSGGEDRAFEVACGGLLLARFLHQRSDQGKFQLGLHQQHDAGYETAPHPHSAVLADTALLATAAGVGQLVLSDVVAAGIARPGRLEMQALSHPLGTDFASAGERCFRLQELAEDYAHLIESQLALLLGQEGSTANESTF